MNEHTRKDLFEVKGEVTETLPNMMYRAEIKEGPAQIVGKIVLCTLNGNMRRFNIRLLPGDMITAEMSVYDPNRARVTRRLREHDLETTVAPVVPATPAAPVEVKETETTTKE